MIQLKSAKAVVSQVKLFSSLFSMLTSTQYVHPTKRKEKTINKGLGCWIVKIVLKKDRFLIINRELIKCEYVTRPKDANAMKKICQNRETNGITYIKARKRKRMKRRLITVLDGLPRCGRWYCVYGTKETWITGVMKGYLTV